MLGGASILVSYHIYVGAWDGQLCLLCIRHFDGVTCSMVRVVNQVFEVFLLVYLGQKMHIWDVGLLAESKLPISHLF